MNKEELFTKLKKDLQDRIHFLEDKPEETTESTLKALWLAAAGIQKSAEEAMKAPLPELSKTEQQKLQNLIELRLSNTPLAHITCRQNFMGLELITDKRALIPRKETEILGRKALELSEKITKAKGKATVIDVCCGSGNLGCSIASYNPNCTVFATDLSDEAAELTRENVNHLGLTQTMQVRQGDFLSAFENDEFYGKVDLIVCNPPYISTSKVSKMHAEIAINEPTLAFDGGMMGIKILQKLISESPRYLTNGGWVIFEVGLGQGPFVMQLMERSTAFFNIGSETDHSGNVRAIYAQKKPEA
jgi:release factor glutamine methyltransferase